MGESDDNPEIPGEEDTTAEQQLAARLSEESGLWELASKNLTEKENALSDLLPKGSAHIKARIDFAEASDRSGQNFADLMWLMSLKAAGLPPETVLEIWDKKIEATYLTNQKLKDSLEQ